MLDHIETGFLTVAGGAIVAFVGYMLYLLAILFWATCPHWVLIPPAVLFLLGFCGSLWHSRQAY
jgi:hypothetical protein